MKGVYEMNEINYAEKICIEEGYLGEIISDDELKKIDQNGIIAVLPPMGNMSAPDIVFTISTILFEAVAGGVFYDTVKNIFSYLKEKFKNFNDDPKPSMKLIINNCKGMSAEIVFDLDDDDCNKTLEKVSKLLDVLKD